MLSGFADALSLDPELLDDLKTAVSEACNNVVMHAYPPDDEGPLEVVLRLDGATLLAEVRDDGIGIDELRLLDTAQMGLGIPVIRALAADCELRRRPEGGTEVTMRFPAEREGTPLYLLPAPVAEEDDFAAQLAGEATVSASPPSVVGAVLGRLARAMAATAHFSLDRFSDVYLVCDALADGVGEFAAGGRLACALDTQPKRLSVRVGPLRSGSSREITEDPGRHAHSSPLERLSDELRARPSDGAGEVLELVMIDRGN
jgi:anti-sigma regulatory factor (Ser/Thr protein kinase)